MLNMGLGLVSNMLGSKWGRGTIGIALVLFVVGLVVWKAFQSGVNKEKADASIRIVENLRTKLEVDKELQAMPADARRDALRKWVRNDD